MIDIPEAHDPHTDRLLTPAAQAAGADERLRCRVSENRKGVVVLSIEEGNVFVLAAKQSGKDWLLGTEVDEHGNFGMRGVVAKMRAHKDGVFTCVRQRGGGHFAQHLGGGETLQSNLCTRGMIVRHARLQSGGQEGRRTHLTRGISHVSVRSSNSKSLSTSHCSSKKAKRQLWAGRVVGGA